jgi:hypothetical protein
MGKIEEKLEAMGISIPEATTPKGMRETRRQLLIGVPILFHEQ